VSLCPLVTLIVYMAPKTRLHVLAQKVEMPTCAVEMQGVFHCGAKCNSSNGSRNSRRLVVESPDIYDSESMQSYIEQEISRPCKRWIHEVISSRRETERVRLRTNDFVLLPDVDCMNKRAPSGSAQSSRLCIESPYCSAKKSTWPNPNALQFDTSPSKRETDMIVSRQKHKTITGAFHWLAVVTDPSLKTLRDLRGDHIPLLKTIYNMSCEKIFEELGIERDQVLAYVHYPPSVYQLHIHFKYPVKAQPAHDAFRIHPLLSVINNLEVDPDYYAKSFIQIPVYPNTEFYSALLWGGLSTQQKQWLINHHGPDTQSVCHVRSQFITEDTGEIDSASVISERAPSQSISPSLSA